MGRSGRRFDDESKRLNENCPNRGTDMRELKVRDRVERKNEAQGEKWEESHLYGSVRSNYWVTRFILTYFFGKKINADVFLFNNCLLVIALNSRS